jgi:phosphatidylethanolamine/phosphatidyl-N-methylethanolamine N-methyltransferase
MGLANVQERDIRSRENRLFFRRWLANPARLGTLAPITPRLAALAASFLENPSQQRIVEIGAGTGRLTRALLAAGVLPENLIVVELDPDLCDFLSKSLPALTVINGDAACLPDLLPSGWSGTVTTVVSVVPLMYLDKLVRSNIINACFDVMQPGGTILHVTYSPKSPLSALSNYCGVREGSLWANIPPGFVWRYHKQDTHS